MEENSGETPREKIVGADSTAEESEVLTRYLDLKASAYNAQMSADERKEFAQNLIDLVKTLNEGRGIDSVVREDLLKQIHAIEIGYTKLKDAAEAVKQLERQSRGGVLVPHVYEKAVGLVKAASDSGVSERSLEPLHKTIVEYLRMVRAAR